MAASPINIYRNYTNTDTTVNETIKKPRRFTTIY